MPTETTTSLLSRTVPITDQILFLDMDKGAADKKYYLPSYRVAVRNVQTPSGLKPHIQVYIKQDATAWSMSVLFEKYPGDPIKDAVQKGQAKEATHQVQVFLRYRDPAGPGPGKELEFKEISQKPEGLTAVLRGTSNTDLDDLFTALKTKNYNPTLVVRRSLTVMLHPYFTLDVDHLDDAIAPLGPAPGPTPQALYGVQTFPLDIPLESFLPMERYEYVYKGATDGGQDAGLARFVVRFEGHDYGYYQDGAQPNHFFYLPNAYKIGRKPVAPHTPMILLQFGATDGDRDKVTVRMNYTAMPYTDPDRLPDAARQLATMAGVEGPIHFDILPPKAPKFEVAIPRAGGSGGLENRSEHLLNLDTITDSIVLSMDDFQSLYDAMFGVSNTDLFYGKVSVQLGPDQKEEVRFIARLTDMVGDLLDCAVTEGPATVSAILRQAIESPVLIKEVEARLTRGPARLPVRAEALSKALPATLQPGEILTFTINANLPGSDPLGLSIDADKIEVQPDKDRVWDVIVDPSVPAQYTKTITVETFRAFFDAPKDPAGDQLLAVVFDFEGGDSVELVGDAQPAGPRVIATTKLRFPLKDLVLGKSSSGQYRYRVTVVRAKSGQTQTDFKTDTKTILIYSP